jgi:hypothetical protein
MSASGSERREVCTWRRFAPTLLLVLFVASCSSDLAEKPVRRAILEGTIRNPEGQSIANLPLLLVFHPQAYVSGSSFRARTDSTGAFRFEATEGVYDLLVGADYDYLSGFPFVRVSGIHVTAPATHFDYRYQGFPVAGTLTGPTGLPIDSAYVSVFEELPSSDYLTPGFDGPVRAGSQGYRVWLRRPRHSGVFVSPARAYTRFAGRCLRTDTTASDTTLDFVLDGHLVTGAVSLGGLPLDSVEVNASFAIGNDAVLTDASGAYQMYLPSGAYDWFLVPKGPSANIYPYSQPGPDIQGPGNVNFDLAGIRWSGVVRLSTTGDPVPGVTVKAWNGSGYFGATSVSDALGQFSVIVRRPARYNLFVAPSTPGFAGTTIYGVLAGNDSTFDLTVAPATPSPPPYASASGGVKGCGVRTGAPRPSP